MPRHSTLCIARLREALLNSVTYLNNQLELTACMLRMMKHTRGVSTLNLQLVGSLLRAAGNKG
eukprot:scaffold176787_cov27-Prasinocladus_malaysianus.AAC.1